MSRYHSYMLSAKAAIESYDRGQVLSSHLKSFFAASKKFGSRDRKVIASLCYAYFRVSRAFAQQSVEEVILHGVFLTNGPPEILEAFNYSQIKHVGLSVSEKLNLLNISSESIFPFNSLLGEGIVKEKFALSFLKQPALFIRARPGHLDAVKDKLTAAAVAFSVKEQSCVEVPLNTKVDTILKLNADAVVQDLNSQKVLDSLDELDTKSTSAKLPGAWDCCTASGGKSILLFDKLSGKVKLTVSDIRLNILDNLEKRLLEARVPVAEKLVCDLSKKSPFAPEKEFDFIICDAPCTGSGTWSRTPEHLHSFKPAYVQPYHDRQVQIAKTSSRHLKKGGLFFYITCSVFKMENEDIVAELLQNLSLRVVSENYLTGYETAADTMFVAVLTRD